VAVGAARLVAAHRQMEALAPARVLDRGYAVVRKKDGSVLRDPRDVVADDALEIQVAGGRLGARVT
jgi:exodeoxyribonuclease VII large subunit